MTGVVGLGDGHVLHIEKANLTSSFLEDNQHFLYSHDDHFSNDKDLDVENVQPILERVKRAVGGNKAPLKKTKFNPYR